MQLNGKYHSLVTDESGLNILAFAFEAKESHGVRQIVARLKKALENGKERLKISIDFERKVRSLDSNAYFHLLVDKIAKTLSIGADECKRNLNLEYGTPATENGEQIIVALPKAANVELFYPYAKWIGDFKAKNNREYSQYLFYKQTHTLDTKEMARLIEGVVGEAKELGIETKTPEQIAEMNSLWRREV